MFFQQKLKLLKNRIVCGWVDEGGERDLYGPNCIYFSNIILKS